MRKEPDLAAARPRRRFLDRSKSPARPESRFVGCFNNPVTAFVTLFGASVVVLGLYVAIHLVHKEAPFKAEDAVRIAEDGTFEPTFKEAVLQRFFSRQQIVEMEQRVREKAQSLSQSTLEIRRDTLLPVIAVVQNTLGTRGRPGLLGQDAAAVTDAELSRVRLGVLSAWLSNSVSSVAPEQKPVIQQLMAEVSLLDALENKTRHDLQTEVQELEPPLSFCWLYTECGWWVVEVLLWSFLGVQANTIIALIGACREGKYSPAEFVLFFPKILLAPLLALVVVAFWSSGLSESKISYLNLPYFLVFSFALGFVTEGIYEKLRELGRLIVTPSVTLSQTKLEDAARKTPYQYRTRNVTAADLPSANNFDELEKNISTVLKARAERAVVAATALNN